MDAEARANHTDLAALPPADIRQHQFFRLVQRLLQQQPDAVAPGGKGPFEKERVRFRTNTSLGFAPSDIESLQAVDRSDSVHMPPYLLECNQLGLAGAVSPLPAHYTEMLLNEVDELNTPRQFLDLFNHRFISFLYRIWDKYKGINHYRTDLSDQFSRQLLAFMGLAHIQPDESDAIEWNRVLQLAGVLSGSRRSAASIAQALEMYFQVPVAVEQFVLERVNLESDQQTSLGRHGCVLGDESVVGQSVLSAGTRFRLHIGPVDYDTYVRFLPGKRWYDSLRQLVSILLRDPLSFEVWIKVRATEVPAAVLDSRMPARLGQTSWVGRSSEEYIVIKQQGVSV